MNKTKPNKPIDTKNHLSNIPNEHNLPHRRSELLTLYKRLLTRLRRDFNFVEKKKDKIAEPDQDRAERRKSPIKFKHDSAEDDERTFYRDECIRLIRALNTCIGLQGVSTVSQD
jgi:hypothetical protein